MTRVHNGTRKTLLSVIIPAYNVEHFIAASLASALSQPRSEEIELIVIDDGSTDHTLERILDVQRTELGRNIRVIHQENRGVSAARNRAIAEATSPYIGFLDSDDVWSEDFTQKIMPLLDQNVADIIEFNVGIINSAGKVIDKVQLIDPATVGTRPCNLDALLDFARVYQVFPAARVYRRALWDGIEFPAGRVYEDAAAIPLVYARASTLFRLADNLYFYRRRAGSITTRATPYTVTSLTICAEETMERCNGGPLDAFWLAMFHKVFSYACHQAARVDASAFAEAIRTVEATAAHYRAFAANRRDTPSELLFHKKIVADRRWFQAKRVVKRVLGLELRPPAAPARAVPSANLRGRPSAGSQQ
ncbi:MULTISPECIES: glycosyltransferase family 2 protein [unclassified Caballeronia]|uniref:glycosyltransferase family 2 protein n=1 Tax=unclassified Caballeronia TaxID=2646786 RepID=UPI0028609162|nr:MULTISPECIES: glycosyltransferase family 2 protein [unclassified Caballeronia]MDR5818470.1 glycosyltransferase family 2 protein [Caballeronia sp. LZ033]MDR5825437.1 glycosyltransferase family 2 protein [Caballeronia sp. LZ043]MDR5839255.1 glycosyltransferase family 2 protein [Caballeronia sp. LZ034LL]MDR5883315.1 glycosyltransferase family 2 protein [Caballeronia sp. LZ032]